MSRRDLTTVIQQMLVHIPEDARCIRGDFSSILTSIPYSPPEDWQFCWQRTQEALESEIGLIPSKDWHYQIISIWSMQTIESLKEQVEEIKKEAKG